MDRSPLETLCQIVKEALIARGMTPGEAEAALHKLTNGKFEAKAPRGHKNVYNEITELLQENEKLRQENKSLRSELVFEKQRNGALNTIMELEKAFFNPFGGGQ